ncbi:MAG: hypothetical protein WB792_03135 [Desulfobacterales bacterium]
MLPSMEKKGKKIFMNGEDLQEYMSVRLTELSGLIANMAIALVMTSLVIVFTFFKAGDMYYYALILVPLIARWYLGGMVNQWLRKKFKALLST